MITLRTAAAAATSLFVTACASLPPQQVSVLGALPAGQRYAVVQPDKGAPAPLVLAPLETCLQAAGVTPGTPAQVLVQVAHAVRPARSEILQAGEEPRRRGPRPSTRRDREELAVTMTDRASGAVLWRGAVLQILGKAEQAGDGTALVTPLCAAIKAPPAAGSR